MIHIEGGVEDSSFFIFRLRFVLHDDFVIEFACNALAPASLWISPRHSLSLSHQGGPANESNHDDAGIVADKHSIRYL